MLTVYCTLHTVHYTAQVLKIVLHLAPPDDFGPELIQPEFIQPEFTQPEHIHPYEDYQGLI